MKMITLNNHSHREEDGNVVFKEILVNIDHIDSVYLNKIEPYIDFTVVSTTKQTFLVKESIEDIKNILKRLTGHYR